MAEKTDASVTRLLQAWNAGDEHALENLAPLVYQELHRLAHQHMRRERPGHPLQTSALVHEAYLRLVDIDRLQWSDRNHFFAMAGRLMRRILVDFARKRRSLKRGGAAEHVSLADDMAVVADPPADLVAIDEALEALAAVDVRKVRVIELRFFAGLDTQEAARVLGVSPETVRRDWRLARAWLQREVTRTRV
jgi:RNA polymerase sigma factor (TIGR02999 family)